MGSYLTWCWTSIFRQANPVPQVNITEKEGKCRTTENTAFFLSLSTFFPAFCTIFHLIT